MTLVTPSKYFLQCNVSGRLVSAPPQKIVQGLSSDDAVRVRDWDQMGYWLAVPGDGDGLSLFNDLEKFG